MGAEPADAAGAGYAVRLLAASDVELVVDLIAAVAAEGRWIASEQVDRAQRRAQLLATLGAEHEATFVALAGGAVIGQLGIGVRPFGVAELGMQVADGWRGRGVGSALTAAAVDWARTAGAHKVSLQLWPHNEAALALYRKFGFVEEGRLRRHYRRRNGERWDALVMGLLLVDDDRPAGPAPA